MTSLLPIRIYIYEEGFARFATEKYYLGQPFKSNKFMHLTNYAVNKLSKNFVPNLDPLVDNIGSKWSLTALRNYFKTIVRTFIIINILNCFRILNGIKYKIKLMI